MAKSRKNILLTMTTNERKYMRLVVQAMDGKFGVDDLRNVKENALLTYRAKVSAQAVPSCAMIADRELARLNGGLEPEGKKK